MVVIVTRPGPGGKRLTDLITARGHQADWWPAFDLTAAPDVPAARAALARLAEYQLAVFVSAHAVGATGALLAGKWPRTTMIGVVGAATRAAVQAELRPGQSTVISPINDGESGSEAFWDAWIASGHEARRVLLLRAQDGRSWLSERFAASGAAVDVIAVYTRRAHHLSADALERRSNDATPMTIVFTSTEAIAALDQQSGAVRRAWLRTATAVACHPRIAQQLTAAGYSRVVNASFDDDSIIRRLESISA